jgi:hypothetical protein
VCRVCIRLRIASCCIVVAHRCALECVIRMRRGRRGESLCVVDGHASDRESGDVRDSAIASVRECSAWRGQAPTDGCRRRCRCRRRGQQREDTAHAHDTQRTWATSAQAQASTMHVEEQWCRGTVVQGRVTVHLLAHCACSIHRDTTQRTLVTASAQGALQTQAPDTKQRRHKSAMGRKKRGRTTVIARRTPRLTLNKTAPTHPIDKQKSLEKIFGQKKAKESLQV